MHSIYIGQLVQSAAAPLTVRMRVCLWDVAIVYYYPHPAQGKFSPVILTREVIIKIPE